MNRSAQIRFWLIGLAAAALLMWLLRGMLLPFVAGMAIAYFLGPVADRLQRLGLARWLAALLVLLFFLVLLVIALALILPLIQSQITGLASMIPSLVDMARTRLLPLAQHWLTQISPGDLDRLRNAAGQYAGNAVSMIGSMIAGVLTRGIAVVDVLSLLVVTPVVAFYLLRDWHRLIALLDGWLPRDHAGAIRREVRKIDATLAGFVRGQASVCLILGLYYATALSLVGLQFGLVVGLMAGFLSFIPYVGSVVGFGTAIAIALFQYQFQFYPMVLVVIGVFVGGHIAEGYVLTPKLVGDRVGLHPVWVMFALFAGGSLFGFVGVLLAVPVASVIGVLVRFGLSRYLESRYYVGRTLGGPHLP